MPDSRISIAYIIAVLGNAQAGTEGHLLRLIRSLDRNRFAPRLIVFQSSRFMETLEDIPKHILGYQSVCRPADWPRVWELARVLRQHKTDIVELYSPEAQLVGCIAARLSGVPSVLSCRRNLGYQYGRKALIQTKMTNWN